MHRIFATIFALIVLQMALVTGSAAYGQEAPKTVTFSFKDSFARGKVSHKTHRFTLTKQSDLEIQTEFELQASTNLRLSLKRKGRTHDVGISEKNTKIRDLKPGIYVLQLTCENENDSEVEVENEGEIPECLGEKSSITVLATPVPHPKWDGANSIQKISPLTINNEVKTVWHGHVDPFNQERWFAFQTSSFAVVDFEVQSPTRLDIYVERHAGSTWSGEHKLNLATPYRWLVPPGIWRIHVQSADPAVTDGERFDMPLHIQPTPDGMPFEVAQSKPQIKLDNAWVDSPEVYVTDEARWNIHLTQRLGKVGDFVFQLKFNTDDNTKFSWSRPATQETRPSQAKSDAGGYGNWREEYWRVSDWSGADPLLLSLARAKPHRITTGRLFTDVELQEWDGRKVLDWQPKPEDRGDLSTYWQTSVKLAGDPIHPHEDEFRALATTACKKRWPQADWRPFTACWNGFVVDAMGACKRRHDFDSSYDVVGCFQKNLNLIEKAP
jgi:hypothetical protein